MRWCLAKTSASALDEKAHPLVRVRAHGGIENSSDRTREIIVQVADNKRGAPLREGVQRIINPFGEKRRGTAPSRNSTGGARARRPVDVDNGKIKATGFHARDAAATNSGWARG